MSIHKRRAPNPSWLTFQNHNIEDPFSSKPKTQILNPLESQTLTQNQHNQETPQEDNQMDLYGTLPRKPQSRIPRFRALIYSREPLARKFQEPRHTPHLNRND